MNRIVSYTIDNLLKNIPAKNEVELVVSDKSLHPS